MTEYWQIQYSNNGSLVNADVDARNIVGAPLLSAARVASHVSGADTVLAGVFRFTFATSTTVSVQAQHYGDLKSPNLFSGTKSVVCNNSTGNLNLIPGLSIVFASTAAANDQFEIGVGCYWDATNLVWVRILPLDFVVEAGISAERTLYATNVSGQTQCNSQLVVTNAARAVNDQSENRPLYSFGQTGLLNPTADADLLGRAITFTDLVAGSPNTITILVDGTGLDLYDVTNDATLAAGVGAKCDGITVYRFADTTALQSVEFLLSASTAATDTATIYTSDGGDFVEISDGVNPWVPGTTGIYLTSEDAPEGVVLNADNAQFGLRMVCPSGKTTALNQRQFSMRIQSEGA